MIFCEFSETVKSLEKEFSNKWTVFVMTGKTPLLERHKIINNFRDSKKTDSNYTLVGSKGLDVRFCSAVMNYDLHGIQCVWNRESVELIGFG